MLNVTTSWDDGDVLDMKLAALLDKYDIRGTFYINKKYRKEHLSETEIKTLSVVHEIGAHTLTHPDLSSIALEEKIKETGDSKKWLEELLGKEVPMFCYPFGRYDQESVAAVRHAGFRGARTTLLGSIQNPQDVFVMPTTFQVYPMPFRKTGANTYWWSKLLEPYSERSGALRALGVSLPAFRSFEALACATFDIALERGEVFHLWGHSWEIEKYDMWDSLERVLRYISKRPDCTYVTNGELLDTI